MRRDTAPLGRRHGQSPSRGAWVAAGRLRDHQKHILGRSPAAPDERLEVERESEDVLGRVRAGAIVVDRRHCALNRVADQQIVLLVRIDEDARVEPA